ncbi:hypothetical protein EV424DRAFT_1532204 [Suillus variegatus]|nr:hypothetical protein EV424DRAFT_1532204 [Suillus variegatus]
MPPRTFASPKKRRPTKCKGSDATSTKNVVKKSRAQETSIEASSMPLVSLGLVHADTAGTDAPRRPVRSKAGTGGRAAQLEKIGALLEAPSQTNQCKGSTLLGPNILINPQAPELTRSRKGQKSRSKAAPPPYTNVPDTSKPCSIVEPLQPLGFLLCQQKARFGFADNSLIVTPEPNLNHLYDAVGRNIPKKFAKNTGIGHTAAHSVAPPTTGFLEWNLDPVLCDANIGAAEFQSTGVHSSTDEEDGEDDEDNEDNENDEDNGDEQNAGPEEEMREQEIGWGEVGRRHSNHPGFSREEPPLHTHLPPSCCLMPDFDFTFSRDEDDMATQVSLGGVANSARQPGMESQDPLDIQRYNASQNPFLTLVKDLPASVTEVLVAVLVAWDQEGKQFEAGIWPQQKPNMAQLKSVMSIAPVQYSLIPPPSVPTQLHAEWIEKAAAALLANSLFLHHGVDNMGKTRNFAHPALQEGVTAFFYTGPYRIAQRQPDIFRNQLPLSCLALVGAAFNCILNSLRKNDNRKYYPKFTTKEYGPIYRKMLQLLKDILKDHYYGPILLAQLREWAQVGWAESSKIDDAVESRHDRLQIILD